MKKGRLYQVPGRKVWMIAYRGPKGGKSVEIRESAKTRDRAEAEALLEKRLREVANDHDGLVRFEGPKKPVTVAALLDALLADWERRSIKGLVASRRRVRVGSPLRNAFGSCIAGSVTPDAILRYSADRLRGKFGSGRPLANATVNREIEALRKAYNLGIKNDRIRWAPAFPEMLPEAEARQGFFERAELDLILPHLPAPMDQITLFGYFTGWRRGEILGLKWEQIDRRGGEIKLPTSKNGKPRAIKIAGPLAPIMERAWASREYRRADGATALSPFVFHRFGKAIFYTVAGKQFRRAAKKAGLPGKLFHDLRRTAARNMIRAGVPETVAMRVTGHVTRSMFGRYAITNLEDTGRALSAAGAYTDANAGEAQPPVDGSDRFRGVADTSADTSSKSASASRAEA
jgi:integrase